MKTIRHSSILLAFAWSIAIFGSPVSGAEPTEEAPRIENPELERRIAAFEEAQTEARKPVLQLQDQYAAQLGKLKSELAASGNLEGALAIEKEMEVFRSGESAPGSVEVPGLQRVRSLYENALPLRTRAVESALAETRKQYIADLEKYQAFLTKGDALAAALEVKTYLDSFTREPAPAEPVIEIELFWSPKFEGESVKLTVPVTINRFAQDDRVKNDKLRSIRIPKGVAVTLGSGAHLEGNTIRLRRDTEDIELRGITSLHAE